MRRKTTAAGMRGLAVIQVDHVYDREGDPAGDGGTALVSDRVDVIGRAHRPRVVKGEVDVQPGAACGAKLRHAEYVVPAAALNPGLLCGRCFR